MIVEEKTEESKNKTGEKQDNKVLEVAKQVLQPNKKSLAWTEERKRKQALAMAKLQAQGRGYKGKKQKELEKYDDDKIDESGKTIPDTSPLDDHSSQGESSKSSLNPLMFIILFFAALITIVVFFVSKLSGEKKDE